MEEPIEEIKPVKEKTIYSKISKVQSYLGQVNSMQEFVEDEMTDDEYYEFCDSAASLVAGLRLVWKRLNEKRKKLESNEETTTGTNT